MSRNLPPLYICDRSFSVGETAPVDPSCNPRVHIPRLWFSLCLSLCALFACNYYYILAFRFRFNHINILILLNYLLNLNYTTNKNIMPINTVPSASMSMSCMSNVNDTKQLVIPVITLILYSILILDTQIFKL